MLVDTYNPHWLSQLREQAASLDQDRHLHLLIDGVFLPGLYREIAPEPVLLFKALPGCSEAVKDVSPFLLSYRPDHLALDRVLAKCSGWPMVSTIETEEELASLAARLASWCVVYADGQRFNFRFPDTRRLPGIFRALTIEQQGQLIGPASRWRYIDRSGQWADLHLSGLSAPVISDWPTLEAGQFGQMVGDSAPDEIMLRLSDRGHSWPMTPSQCHAIVIEALKLADHAGLGQQQQIDWCEACLIAGGRPGAEELARWKKLEQE